MVTWVYEAGSFVPTAKIIGDKKFSIINDYIGRPIQVYSEEGDVVWETDYDIYGNLRNLKGDRGFIPFRQLGQYDDIEISLYYNRFRYYNPDTGTYLSQDPIGLIGGNQNLYSYTRNTNRFVDVYGLAPWPSGGFGEWFDNASVQDVLDNKSSVSDALRGSGGMHEKFPVSMAAKAKELGFSHSELMDLTIEREKVWFNDVPDSYGGIHSGPHSTGAKLPDGQSSKASPWFHKNLMADLDGAKTKADALEIIDRHHKKFMTCK